MPMPMSGPMPGGPGPSPGQAPAPDQNSMNLDLPGNVAASAGLDPAKIRAGAEYTMTAKVVVVGSGDDGAVSVKLSGIQLQDSQAFGPAFKERAAMQQGGQMMGMGRG